MAITFFKSLHDNWFDQSFAAGYTVVFVIPPDKLLCSVTSVKILFSFKSIDRNFGELWIGHPGAGDPYDFDGNQVKVQVGGSDSWVIDSDDIWSDEVAFALDPSKALLLAAYLPTDSYIPRLLCWDSNQFWYYKIGNDAATTDKSDYTGPTWATYTILYAELIGPAAYQLSGTVKEKGSPVSRVVRSYKRSTGELFASGSSAGDGTFSIDAPNDTDEMYVLALDDDAGDQYNALVFDRVKGA
uniref:Uncharacterized protein n=1 Tax=viral metagenome TaxID=1070528 RepID=A0A6H1Z7R4_9ZZZZ